MVQAARIIETGIATSGLHDAGERVVALFRG